MLIVVKDGIIKDGKFYPESIVKVLDNFGNEHPELINEFLIPNNKEYNERRQN